MSADGKLHPEVERAHTTLNFGSQPFGGPGVGRGAPHEGIPNSGLGARIGRHGDVYEAHSPRLEGRLALKLYRRANGVDQGAVDAFSREAARAVALRHPHIAQVIESGALRDGTPFATMEYLIGHTLEEQLVGRGAFLATELLPVIRGTASALSAAHAADLAHGEIRPDNIFIADVAGYEHGFVKLLDFGAWRLTAAQIGAGRDPGVREMRYLAPERLLRPQADADARADQFALAAIAHRMLIGSDPPAANLAGAAGAGSGRTREGASTASNPLARRAPAVEAVISKALNKQPESRFESVALFMRAFEEALAGAALISTPAPTRTIAPTSNREEYHSPERRYGGPTPLQHAVSDRLTLTQQFFDEGERQEAANYKNVPLDSRTVSNSSLDFESFDRVPRRRKPLVFAVLVTIAGAGVLAWTAGLRPPEAWRHSALWRELHLPDMPSAATTELTKTSRELERVPPAAMPPAPPSPVAVEPVAVQPVVVEPVAVEPVAATVPAGIAPVSAASAAPAPTPASAEPMLPSPTQAAVSPPDRGSSQSKTPPPHATRSRGSSQRSALPPHAPALRGYIWSPAQHAMIPARPPAGRSGQSEPWPPASESPPPPPFRPQPPPTDPSLGPPPFNP